MIDAVTETAGAICQQLDAVPVDVMLQTLCAVIVSACLTYEQPEVAAKAISLTVAAALGSARGLASMPVAGSC